MTTPTAKLLKVGGPERDRTAGLLVANEALSQLSYRPTLKECKAKCLHISLISSLYSLLPWAENAASDGSRVLIQRRAESLEGRARHPGIAADANAKMLRPVEETAGYDAGFVLFVQ